VGEPDIDRLCLCDDPEFVKHAGWWICKHCWGGLPWIPTFAEAIEYMRTRIDEGRASVARQLRSE
jgi:hypothetical protein